MKLLIRADAGAEIGTGHVMRCLALAQKCLDDGGEATFVMAGTHQGLHDRLRREGMSTIALAAPAASHADASETIEAARRAGARWVVVDGYHFDGQYQADLKNAGLKVLFLDDFGHAKSYAADLVLNQNAHAREEMYVARSSQTHLLLGTRYAMLRREFWRERAFPRPIPALASKVLVTMGGSDPDNLTLRVIEALERIGIDDLQAVIVVGGANPNITSLREAVSRSRRNLRLLFNVENMAELMKWADIAISAAGTTSYEICSTGLPAILLDIAANQTAVARELSRLGAATHVSDIRHATPEDIAAAILQLMKSAASRAVLSREASRVVDGQGVQRVLSAICRCSLELRRAHMDDCKLLWEWANDASVRSASFTQEAIPWHDHVAWFSKKLADRAVHMFVAVLEGIPVGQVRLDGTGGGEAEVGISVAREQRGQGYASCIIGRAALEAFRNGWYSRLHAFVRPGNHASATAFETAGFQKLPPGIVRGNEALHFILNREDANAERLRVVV